MVKYNEYEMVIGLEVHVELATASKIFCNCSTAFGAEPNTQCCPVCMGLPGTLPVLNRRAVELAVKAGLALECEIAHYSKQDRKNYFYPDLPKSYQISQYDLPLCRHGTIQIETATGRKHIGITRIHIEEDAGKLVHTDSGTLIDYNRCGIPLIEIVSEPEIFSAEEAVAYLRKLRTILRYAGVSDCHMQEGSMRCDVNLSIRKKGDMGLGTRTEIKNLNSYQFITKAIDYEFKRQVEQLEDNGKVVQVTCRFDQMSGKTVPMRRKENADDYRYFPDPDLVPIEIDPATIERIKKEIPVLPDIRKKRYIERYHLKGDEAETLASERMVADYFEEAASLCGYPEVLAHLMLSEVFRLLTPEYTDIPISYKHMATIAELFGAGKINHPTAKKLIQMLWEKDCDPLEIIERENLLQLSDEKILLETIQLVLKENPSPVIDYRSGKKKAIQVLVGKTMAKTAGKGNPRAILGILKQLLEE